MMKTTNKIIWLVILAAIVALGFAFAMFWGPSLATFLIGLFKKSFMIFLPLAIAFAGGLWFFNSFDSHGSNRSQNVSIVASIISVLMVVVGVVGFFVVAFFLSSWSLMQYQNDISAVDEPVPTFDQRPPYQQARSL